MLFSFDALVASIVLVLPGFLIVGTVVALVPSWERIRLSPATYVLLSLGASIPLHLTFAYLAGADWSVTMRPWFRAFDTIDFTILSTLAFSLEFIRPAVTVLSLSLLVGLIIALVLKAYEHVKKLLGHNIYSQKTVWRMLFEGRNPAPHVIVLMSGHAYKGQPTIVTTTNEDPYIFLQQVSVMPYESTTLLPDWSNLSPLDMEGLLVSRREVKEIWFLNEDKAVDVSS